MKEKEIRIHLPKIDDIFKSNEQLEDEKLDKVRIIPVDKIDDFPNHPFKILVNDEMQEMVDSIKEKGVLVPTIVRQKEDGRYEMISGHRRKKASELAKLDTIPCIVRNLTDDEATIIMVDSNLQREKILPSEKAFAYKLKMDAISHQGKETYRPMGEKLKSVDIIAKDNNDSSRKVHRYIRLTERIPEVLPMVHNDVLKETPSMAFRPAVEISYLSKDEQTALLDLIECYDCTPSLAQAIKLKNMSQNNTLTVDDMEEIMEESKPNQTSKLKVSMNRLNNILPNTLKNDREREEYVIKAVEWYDRYQKKMRERKEIGRASCRER